MASYVRLLFKKKKSSWHERGNEHKEREAWSEVRQDHVYPQLEGILSLTGTKMSTGEDGTQLLIGAEGDRYDSHSPWGKLGSVVLQQETLVIHGP